MSASSDRVSDDELAAFLDGSLPASRHREVQAIVERNPVLQAQVSALAAAQARLQALPPAMSSLSTRVLAEIEAPPRRTRAMWALPPLAALAAAALLLLSVRIDDDEGGLVPRGAATDHVQLVVRAADGVVRDGDVVSPHLRLAVDVNALPAPAARAVAAFARDADGVVTWLQPAFVDAAKAPACLMLGPEPLVLPATQGVAFEAAEGPLRVAFVVRAPGDCDVAALDVALEAGDDVGAIVAATLQVKPSAP